MQHMTFGQQSMHFWSYRENFKDDFIKDKRKIHS